jgi:hypothetical protein
LNIRKLCYFHLILKLCLLNAELILSFHISLKMEYFDRIFIKVKGIFILKCYKLQFLLNIAEYVIIFYPHQQLATIYLYKHIYLVAMRLSFIFDFLPNNLCEFEWCSQHFIVDCCNPTGLKTNFKYY